jgi:spore coat polysaccharide biosynthesis protein SpsF
MPKIVLIIQARMSSTRLPGKSMMLLAGKPLVFRMVERLKKCKKIDEIVKELGCAKSTVSYQCNLG